MFTNKKVIIFYMDGTLIDSIGIWNQVDAELIARLGNVRMDEREIQKQRDEKLREYNESDKPYHNYCGYLGNMYGSLMSAEEIHTLRYEIANEFLVHEIDYKPYADELIRSLKEQGYVLVIATTTRKKNMDIYRYENEKIRSKAPIDEYFSLVYTREDAVKIKPDPEIYLKVLETLQVKAEECLVFEDSLIGIEAANAAGIDAVAVYDKYSDQEWEDICRIATFQIESFAEII